MDMREVIKKYGRDIGITIMAVKIYAKQLFVALKHLKSLKILHADLKPDNIVTNQQKTVLKVCDLGKFNFLVPFLINLFLLQDRPRLWMMKTPLRLTLCLDFTEHQKSVGFLHPQVTFFNFSFPSLALGLPYDYAIDVWAAGCCFYEMYTG